MADICGGSSSSTCEAEAAAAEKQKKKPSSLISNFTTKGGVCHESETMMMSPTSIVSGFRNPFWSESNSPRTPTKRYYWDKLDSKGVGLALLDEVAASKPEPETRMVLFGSQLKIQIPPFMPSTSSERVFSASELELMELSEDYTRVISHGPNPMTTHIFGNCVIESTTSSASSSSSSSSSAAKGNGCLVLHTRFAFTATRILATGGEGILQP